MSVESTQTLIPNQERTFFIRHRSKFFVLAVWVIVIAIYWRVAQDVAPTLEDKVHLVADWFLVPGWGIILFLMVFTFQPLVFFPSFIMSILSGLLYGPIWGMILSIVGLNTAATVSYGTARLLGEDAADGVKSNRWLSRYIAQLHTHTFETLLTLHLLYVPFDMLNYLAGFMRLNWRRFAPATALGTIPSGLVYVLFGNSLGSLDQIASGRPEIDYSMLLLSLGLGIITYVGARYLRREKQTPQAELTN